MLVGSARDYADFARDCFEVDVREEIVARFFALEPLRPELARALHAETDLAAIAEDLDEIGYPIAT